ncbi:MAG: serine/threonine-protein kinase [Steroidobacter sp.]
MWPNLLTRWFTRLRWARINDVFSAAVECESVERGLLLDRYCGTNSRLRRDVESLLSGHDRAGPVDRLAQQLQTPAQWRAHIDAVELRGCHVAQYVISEPLAAGAMGCVYKAHDTRLQRAVALKFLAPHLSDSARAKEDFLREARAAAAIDHPNICAIHEIGATADGQMFIVMPLYQGTTLRARIARGPLPFDESIAIGLQLANALSKAHRLGVIHRDLKPSNIVLLDDGLVKILDFGVAQLSDVARDDVRVTGTLAYMSPEQVRSELLDHRTDVWSLGVVLYEMILGRRPFRGRDREALKSAILDAAPKLTNLPPQLHAVFDAALAKSPGRRYAFMTSFANDLAALIGQAPDSTTRAPRPNRV